MFDKRDRRWPAVRWPGNPWRWLTRASTGDARCWHRPGFTHCEVCGVRIAPCRAYAQAFAALYHDGERDSLASLVAALPEPLQGTDMLVILDAYQAAHDTWKDNIADSEFTTKDYFHASIELELGSNDHHSR
jgi:hypothetical protein